MEIVTGELLGEVVTWDLRSTDVSFAEVQAALLDAGLNPDDATELSPRSAFGRACKHLKEERTIDKLAYDKDAREYNFQFTRKTVEENRVEFDYECVVSVEAETGAVKCPERPDLEQKARELLQHALKTRNAQDVTRLVQKLFQNHADLYPINPRKGVAYFVPEVHREFTAKVDDFLKRLGGCLMRFPVPKGTPEGNASVKEAVQSGLATLLGELTEAVEGWDDTTRTSTMDKAVSKWEAIQYKTEAYAEYLGSEQEKLLERLKEAKEELVRRMTDLRPESKEEETAATQAAA